MRVSTGKLGQTSTESELHGCRLSKQRLGAGPSQAALGVACSELLAGEYDSRQRARSYLRRHSGGLQALPVDVLRGLVSAGQEPHVVVRVLRELQYHPRAVERSAPVLVHLMRHGEAHVAAAAGKLLGSSRSVRDAVAVPVLVLGSSEATRHQAAARAFESRLRGEEIFDLEVYRPSFDGFRGKSGANRAESVYREKQRDWYSCERGRSVVFGALACEDTHAQRVALDALLTFNYASMNDQMRASIEISLAFNARNLVSHESPRLIRDLFMMVASNLEYSPELASIFLESAHQTASLARRGEISPEISAKLYYGAAALLRGESSEEAVQGLGAFLGVHDPKLLERVAKRLVQLSAVLPESAGEGAVGVLFSALRARAVVEVPESERRVLLRALRDVSGYDAFLVGSCAKLLAEEGGDTVEKVVTEVLQGRLIKMLDDDALRKATAIVNYIGRKRPGAGRVDSVGLSF